MSYSEFRTRKVTDRYDLAIEVDANRFTSTDLAPGIVYLYASLDEDAILDSILTVDQAKALREALKQAINFVEGKDD
jgi:hypothetical protein